MKRAIGNQQLAIGNQIGKLLWPRLLLTGAELARLQLTKRAVISMNENDSRGDVASSQRPRSPRVPVEFPLDVEGNDRTGKPFQTKATATKISRGGATLLIDVDVPVGAILKLVPPFGGVLEAEVNGSWTDDLDGARRIGVKLLADDGWFAE